MDSKIIGTRRSFKKLLLLLLLQLGMIMGWGGSWGQGGKTGPQGEGPKGPGPKGAGPNGEGPNGAGPNGDNGDSALGNASEI